MKIKNPFMFSFFFQLFLVCGWLNLQVWNLQEQRSYYIENLLVYGANIHLPVILPGLFVWKCIIIRKWFLNPDEKNDTLSLRVGEEQSFRETWKADRLKQNAAGKGTESGWWSERAWCLLWAPLTSQVLFRSCAESCPGVVISGKCLRAVSRERLREGWPDLRNGDLATLTGGKGTFKAQRIRKANREVSVVISRIMTILLEIKAFLKVLTKFFLILIIFFDFWCLKPYFTGA